MMHSKNKPKLKDDSFLKVVPISEGINPHPDPPHDNLLKHPFSLALVSPKGAGKTTIAGNLLRMYQKYFEDVFVFSPTLMNDPKWKTIKKMDLLSKNKRLSKFLAKVAKEEDKKRKDEKDPILYDSMTDEKRVFNPDDDKLFTKPWQAAMRRFEQKEFDPKVPEENFIVDLDPSKLNQIIDQQQEWIDYIQSKGGDSHLANRTLIICDDIVGSGFISQRKDAPFTKLNVLLRHLNMSLIEISQAFKELPRTIRTQFSGCIILDVPNEQQLKSIYEEFPCHLSWKEWEKAYRHCVSDDYGFMFINNQKPKQHRIFKTFQYPLTILLCDDHRIEEESEEGDKVTPKEMKNNRNTNNKK